MKKGRGVITQAWLSVWWWCGPLAGMHGMVAMVSCTASQHGFHLCHDTTTMRGKKERGRGGVNE